MTSRIDPFFDLVFEELNGRGQSYRAVSEHLLKLGVEVSHQALRSWHLRRVRKITARRTLTTEPTAASAQIRAPKVATPIHDRTIEKGLSKKDFCSEPMSRQATELQQSIVREQEFLASNPFNLNDSKFLLQRK